MHTYMHTYMHTCTRKGQRVCTPTCMRVFVAHMPTPYTNVLLVSGVFHVLYIERTLNDTLWMV